MSDSHSPDERPADDRSLVAVAYAWASRVITICLEMVLPGLAGIWIDGKLGTLVLFTLVGFGLGLTLGIWHLVKLTKPQS